MISALLDCSLSPQIQWLYADALLNRVLYAKPCLVFISSPLFRRGLAPFRDKPPSARAAAELLHGCLLYFFDFAFSNPVVNQLLLYIAAGFNFKLGFSMDIVKSIVSYLGYIHCVDSDVFQPRAAEKSRDSDLGNPRRKGYACQPRTTDQSRASDLGNTRRKNYAR